MARCGRKADQYLARYKSRLFATISGIVLEIGPGAGANLRHLPRNIGWIGVEPNPYMNRHLTQEAARLGMQVELLCGAVEELPLETASIDYTVSTLVLCSVVDPRQAL